jgi:tetraacyldisaccharide-1-P 4'-kinase
LNLVATLPFADHHPFTASDIAKLAAMARSLNAEIVTTEKDAARLAQCNWPAETPLHILPVRLDAPALLNWIDHRLTSLRA